MPEVALPLSLDYLTLDFHSDTDEDLSKAEQ
jgi:hypothetical protein